MFWGQRIEKQPEDRHVDLRFCVLLCFVTRCKKVLLETGLCSQNFQARPPPGHRASVLGWKRNVLHVNSVGVHLAMLSLLLSTGKHTCAAPWSEMDNTRLFGPGGGPHTDCVLFSSFISFLKCTWFPGTRPKPVRKRGFHSRLSRQAGVCARPVLP